MIRFFIYIFALYLLFKKLYYVFLNYKEYYSINKLNLNLVKANNNQKRNHGLMYRKEQLQNNEGMLFIYSKPQIIKMWMKNTYIPLDLLFLDNNMKVIEYKENLIPHDVKTNYISKNKYKYAIEINGGSIKKNNIKEGTIIIPKYIKSLSK
jgi:uncharacterized protein